MDGDERWRVLRLHVEDQVPLAALARDAGISARTLQRWHRLYRVGGIVALDPRPRADTGTRRTAAATVAFVTLALASYRDWHEHVRVWKIQFVFVVLVGLLVIDDQFAAA